MTKKLCLTLYICGNHQTTCNDLPPRGRFLADTQCRLFFVLISISNHHENKSGSIALSLVKIL